MKVTVIHLKPLLTLLVSLVCVLLSYGQEICSNGIDDDGDGLIDEYDPDCHTAQDCFIIGEEADFSLMLPEIQCSAIFASPSAYSSPIAGDVDGDGEVEVMVIDYANNRLMVISGVDCSLEGIHSFPAPSFDGKAGTVALGDVDGDGFTDIFVAYGRGAFNPYAIRRIEFNGTAYVEIWDTDDVATADRKHIDIVDINEDGQPEIIPNGGFMVNAVTGATYSGALPAIDEDGRGLYAFSAAADSGNNGNEGNVELIVGSSIYRYDFFTDNWNLIRQVPTLTSNYWGEFSKTALADLDLDGDLDAVVSAHQLGEYVAWDLQTDAILGFGDTGLGTDPSLGLSRASIGNLDDDAYPEIVMVYRNALIAIEDVVNSNAATSGFSNLWSLTTADGSGHTQATLFDFDYDGKQEIVYRDVGALRIFRGDADAGAAEEIYNSGANSVTSETGMEYPVIVDADGDGRANILTISDADGTFGEGLHIFRSSGNSWANSRAIWNTQAYSATNVNDDGTIPAVAQDNFLVYNDFLTQHGQYTPLPPNHVPTPDLIMSVATEEGIEGIIYDNCPDYGIAIQICNQGDADSEQDFNIEVYDGDPTSDAGAVFITTQNISATIEQDSCIIQNVIFTPNAGTSYDFHFFINHVDNSPSYPITPSLVERTVIECDYTNNELAHVFSCNKPPELVEDSITACSLILESVDVLANDSDEDGNLDPNTITIITPPNHGTAVLNGTNIDFTANDNYAGLDSLEYAVSDTGIPILTSSTWVYFEILLAGDPGTSTTVDVCSSGVVDLITLLGGTPDTNGSWSDANGNPHGDTFDPSFESSQILTYDLSSVSGCPGNLSTVDLTVIEFNEAGTGSNVVLCSSDNPTNMFTLLSGNNNDASGQWYNDTDTQVSSLFTPGTTPAGDYYYVVSNMAPCLADTAFLTITIEQSLDPGDDGTLSACETAGSLNLFNQLIGAPASDGTWTDPNGDPHLGTLETSLLLSGLYTYEIPATANCPAISSSVNVDITPTADPGISTSLELCNTIPTVDLLDMLDGTPETGGLWTDPNGDPHSGSLDVIADIEGVYTYTIDLNAPCVPVTSQLDVNIDTSFDPGENSSVTLCDAGGAEVILSLLEGTPDANGVWSFGGSNITINTFDPQTNAAGIYTYIVPANGVCPAIGADLNIQIDSQPNAGATAQTEICNYDSAVLLTSLLNGDPDTNGDWFDASDQLIQSSINSSNTGTFDFTYIVFGNATCPNDTSFLELTILEQLSAGTGSNYTICESAAAINLNDDLSADATLGGNWFTPDNTAFDGIVDPAVSVSGNYIYEVVSPAVCNNLTATFNVQIEEAPDAGETGGTAFFCDIFTGFDMFSSLDGTPQQDGYFTDPNGDLVTDFSSPANHPSGEYTYHANATGVCPESTATLNVVINEIGNAGLDTEVTLCENIGEVDLITLLDGTPESGGDWYDENNNLISNLYTPTEDVELKYRRSGGFPCPVLSTDLVITISEMTYAGENASVSTCETGGPYDLADHLSGEFSTNGYWEDPNGTVLSSAVVNPSSSQSGSYIYLTNPNAECPQDTAVVDVEIVSLPNAGEDGFLLVCSLSDPVSLLDYLDGSPASDGTWVAPDNSTVDDTFDPNSDIPGQYTYQVMGVAPCPTTAATASVQVADAPHAGEDQVITICSTDDPIDLEAFKSSSVTPGTFWIDTDENPTSSIEDPSDFIGGTYLLVAPGDAPCVNDTAIFTVNVSRPAIINLSDVLLCNEDEPVDLIDFMQIEHAESYLFKDSEFNVFNGTIDPSIEESQTVWIVANPFAPCASDSAMVDVIINTPSNPGLDTLINTCYLYDSFNVFPLIGGKPDEGGTLVWLEDSLSSIHFDPSQETGSHFIEYIAPEVEACPSYSSWMQIDVYNTPEPDFSIDADDADLSNPIFYFENESEGDLLSFSWDFDGLGESNDVNAEFTFPEGVSDEYLVCLTAESAAGCQAEVCELVEVKDILNHFIPTSFTPNGDGDNDLFFIRGRGIDEDFFHLMIYSRNGDLVYETRDLTDSWDGTWYGEDVPTDIYSYRLIIKARDTSERKEIMGHITLLR